MIHGGKPVSVMRTVCYESPIGELEISGDDKWIYSIEFAYESNDEEKTQDSKGDENQKLPAPLMKCKAQLDEYFAGNRTGFSLPLSPRGTPFQKKVWGQLLKIDFGKTKSYKEIAEAVGSPGGMRAVGGANGKNPITIVIPCHRVIADNGTLGGYGGGLWRKEWLLKHENSWKQ